MRAIEADKKNGMAHQLGLDFAVCATVFKRKGQTSKAKASLTNAFAVLKECGAVGWFVKYQKEFGEI